jgi:C4-dicarboxylate-specific signal transduction histidine kinase
MAASIAHEINQPLASIALGASAGLRWLARTPPAVEEARGALNEISQAVDRAGQVIDGIRAMFKNDSRKKVLLDVNQVIREVLLLLHFELQNHQILVQSELNPKLPLVVADRVQLQQVIANLVTNAIEAMDLVADHTRKLRVKTVTRESDGVLIAIEDTGPGIEQERFDRIFDPFFTTKSQGMGMGLAICRSIIEAHGGNLWASPGTTHGSVFHVALPIRLA